MPAASRGLQRYKAKTIRPNLSRRLTEWFIVLHFATKNNLESYGFIIFVLC